MKVITRLALCLTTAVSTVYGQIQKIEVPYNQKQGYQGVNYKQSSSPLRAELAMNTIPLPPSLDATPLRAENTPLALQRPIALSVTGVNTLTAPISTQRLIKPSYSRRARLTSARTIQPRQETMPVPMAPGTAFRPPLTSGKGLTMPAPTPRRDTIPDRLPQPVLETRPEVVEVPAHVAPEIPIAEDRVIKSTYLELAFNKTVSVIFPMAIQAVDLGSRDIIADKAANVDNVLKVKATKLGFNETNFSVITADGKFWSFVVTYNESPRVLALNLASREKDGGDAISINSRNEYLNGQDSKDGIIQFANVRTTQSEVVESCYKIIKSARRVRHIGVEANLMEASVRGVFILENVIYYKIVLENKSNINYDIDMIRFFVVDKSTAKRTSTQDLEVVPFYVHNENIKVVKGHQSIERVYAFPKFTIPDNKQIQVMANEVNGGRNLSFQLTNSDVMGADKL